MSHNDPAHQQAVQSARKALAKVQAINAESLARVEELGTHGALNEVVGPFRRTVQLFATIHADDLSSLSSARVRDLQAALNGVIETHNELTNYKPQGANPADIRQKVVDATLGLYESTFDPVFPTLAYLAGCPAVLQRGAEEQKASNHKAEERIAALDEDIKSRLAQIDALLARLA